MRSWIPNGLAFLTIFFGSNYVQAEGSEPQRHFPHAVALDISFDRTTFEAREPLIARVTLTNHSDSAFRLELRRNGPPIGVSLEVASIDQTYRSHALWLRRIGPEREEIELQPGDSTIRNLLVLLNHGNETYVFPSAGTYQVRCYWVPERSVAKVYSNEFQVTVVAPSTDNRDVLTELEHIALQYHGLNTAAFNEMRASDAKKALEREGLLLLARIVRQQKPHLVIPERDPSQQKEAELVESLKDLLDRHRDSSYSGYIARFLGLVYVKTFKHEVSHAGGKHWDADKMRAQPTHQKALQYLTMASEAELWPKSTAFVSLAQLHGLAKEWDKASECLDSLRTQCKNVNGVEIADKLESELKRFRAKTQHRKNSSK